MPRRIFVDPSTKRFLQSQVMWLAISLGISLALSILLPFPYNLIATIAFLISMNYFIRQRQMRKMGMRGGSLWRRRDVWIAEDHRLLLHKLRDKA